MLSDCLLLVFYAGTELLWSYTYKGEKDFNIGIFLFANVCSKQNVSCYKI